MDHQNVSQRIPAATNTNRRHWWSTRLLVAVASILLVVCILAVAFFVQDSDTAPAGLVFVIPAGAAEKVEVPTIDSAIDIPTEIVFQPDEVAAISIVNEDSVANRAGPWVVGPGQTYTLRLENPGEYRFDCSVDPAESVVVIVEKS